MKKIRKEDIIIFISTFIITCIIFIPFLQGHYATDTYNIDNVGYYNYAINWSLKDGRIFMAIFGLIAGKMNISIELYVFITLFFALLISNISIVVLNRIIKRYKKPNTLFQKIVLVIMCYITIFNFMYLENIYFVENIVMSISILLFLISSNVLVEKNKKYIIKSLILTILGVISYQGTIGVMFVFLILFTILKNKNNGKQILIDLIQCGIIAFAGVLLNLMAVKIISNILQIKQTRLGQISDIPRNIATIILTLPSILQNTCDLFPKNGFIVFLILLITIILIYDIKNKNHLFVKSIIITLIAIMASNITYILTLSSFDAGRLRNALGILIGIIFILIYVKTNLFEEKRKLNIIPVIALFIFVILNVVNYENLMLQHKKVNKLEKQEIEEIEEYINKYEETTGTQVNKIAKILINDNEDKEYFPDTKNKNSLTRNALRAYWSADGVVNFYTGENLEIVIITQEEKDFYIQNRDEERGYKCIGDTLYIEVYIV